MITEAERTDARRHMGYPAEGTIRPSGGGVLEQRLLDLTAAEADVLRVYLSTLATLERAVTDAGVGLDTASAAGWVRNPAELSERLRLFDAWRRRLCAFLGVPPGPALRGGGVVLVV